MHASIKETGRLYGGIEAGGTKFNLALWNGAGRLVSRETIPTTTPDETMAGVFDFFKETGIASLGIGGFGPLCLDKTDARYGNLLNTSKVAWQNFALRDALIAELGVPVVLATDVEAAGMAEGMFGAGAGCRTLAYITVGTGVGCAIIQDGKPLRGRLHSEIGHYFPRPAQGDEGFAGVCHFHGNCLEGLASGPSIPARTGRPGQELDADHEVFGFLADYIAQLSVVVEGLIAPDCIVLGGGVFTNETLLDQVREVYVGLRANYGSPVDADTARRFLRRPASPVEPGLLGALILALDAVEEASARQVFAGISK